MPVESVVTRANPLREYAVWQGQLVCPCKSRRLVDGTPMHRGPAARTPVFRVILSEAKHLAAHGGKTPK